MYNPLFFLRVLQPGRAPHEPVKVPFVLLPETQNEGQFAFTVEQITMPQKLKGTLTYFIKVTTNTTELRNRMIYKTTSIANSNYGSNCSRGKGFVHFTTSTVSMYLFYGSVEEIYPLCIV